MTASIRFGDFEVAPEAYRLRHRGEPVHLEPRVFEVLAYLCERRDRVVSKAELLDALWPEEFVTESALTRTIRDLRRALGDTGPKKRWIETVYGRGFRFAGEATSAAEERAPAPEATPDLLERDVELGQLAALLEESRRGGGRLALVAGEAGIGKSSLIEAFARGDGAPRSLWGSCDALSTPRPLGPLQDLAGGLDGELSRLIAETAPQGAIFAASQAALERAAKPLLVVLEDLHWADAATLDWLKFIGRRLPRLPGLLLIASYRDDEVGATHPLRGVLGELPAAITRRLFLEPLSKDAVAALAKASARPSERLWEITGGNPFFVTEALSAATEGVPPTVRDAVLARAAHLGAAARRVLELVSSVPARVEPWLLEALAGGDDAAITECVDRGVLRSAESGTSFRHELARRAIESSLQEHRRRKIHAQVLDVLRRRKTVAGRLSRLVYHADRAGDSAAVLELGPSAAREAAELGAHREAGAHYAAVLRHADALGVAERAELWRARAYECFLADLYEPAREALGRALELFLEVGDLARVGECHRRLSRLDYFGGRTSESFDAARAAVEILETIPAGAELAQAYAHLAQLYLETWNFEGALEWADKGLDIATRTGDLEARVQSLATGGTARLRLGDESGREPVEASLRLAREHALEEQYARGCSNLLETYLFSRRYAEAEPFVQRSLDFAHERDSDACVHFYLGMRARSRLEQGDWVAAEEHAARALDHPRVHSVSRMNALAVLARTRLRRGDPGWREALEESWSLAAGTGEAQRMAPVAAAWGEAAWLHGETEPARSILAATYERTLPCRNPWALGELAYWGRKAGVLETGLDAVAEPFADQIAGRWRDAASAWERIGCPYEAALALTEGDEDALREGLRRLEGMEARPIAAAARRDARGRRAG